MVEARLVQDYVESALLRRHESSGKHALSKTWMQEEAAFLAGAATVLQCLYPNDDGSMSKWIPVTWALYPMSGRGAIKHILDARKGVQK